MVGGCDSAYARLDNAGNSIHHRPGTRLFRKGLITVGEIATFMALAGMVVARQQAASFANRMTLDAARLLEILRRTRHDTRDARPARRR